MQAYLGGQAANIVVQLVDGNGDFIPADSVSYRVINENEEELVAKTALDTFGVGDESVTVPVNSTVNTLPVGVLRALRVVELYVVSSAGTIKIEQGYFIESEEALVEGTNSFMGYNKALYISYEIPNLPAWNEASRKDRIAALIAARRNIAKLRFRYVFDAYQNIVDNTVGVADLSLATLSQWQSMPLEFREAIQRAQLIEADYLLGGDEIGEYRRAGLMSITTGEAKQFFRPAKAIEGAVCRRAMKELTKWVLTHTRISRS